MAETPLDLYSITAPGLERIAAAELLGLGVQPSSVSRSGVAWRGAARDLYRANLWLRTATRVVVRVTSFHAASFAELESRAKRVPWGRYVRARDQVTFRVTCHKSALYHSDAVAQRLAESVAAATGCSAGGSTADDEDDETASGEQLFIVRIDHDKLTLSADSSGTLLHKRGYRQALAKAPLRETIAAAMLLSSGWKAAESLLDPMCGSGTIPIEAALLARNIAPGIRRDFRFERWPGFDRASWTALRDEASAGELDRAPGSIVGADRDPGAIDAIMSNADRAGVSADIEIVQRPLSESIAAGAARGWVVTNPPYGVRVGTDVRNLYATLGSLMNTSLKGWHLGLLLASPDLERQVGLPLKRLFDTKNGGIPIRFVIG
jgi:putative N6-adenine-specific DNA methylase